MPLQYQTPNPIALHRALAARYQEARQTVAYEAPMYQMIHAVMTHETLMSIPADIAQADGMRLPLSIVGKPYVLAVARLPDAAPLVMPLTVHWQDKVLEVLDGMAKIIRQDAPDTLQMVARHVQGPIMRQLELTLTPWTEPPSNPDVGNPDADNATLQDQLPGDAISTTQVPLRTITPQTTPDAGNQVRTPRISPPPPPRPAQPQRITPRQ